MRLISPSSWALVFGSAILQIAIFPIAGEVPHWRSALCWFALVPFLMALLAPDRAGKPPPIRGAAALGYICGICWYLGNCYWIYPTMHEYGGLPEPVAALILILFSMYLGLYHAVFAILVAGLRRSRLGVSGTLVLTPFIWVAAELARARITKFPWDLLGYTQVDNLFVTGLAPLAGVLSISFVIVAINTGLASFFFLRGVARIRIPAFALVAAMLIEVIRLSSGRNVVPPVSADIPYAVMMQENIEVGEVGKATRPLSLAGELAEFSKWSLNPETHFARTAALADWSTASAGLHPALILWPEAPSHLSSIDPSTRAALGELARKAAAPVIAGSVGVDYSTSAERGYYAFDSASFFNAEGTYSGRYDKIHLVPWGEYIPYKQFFSFAKKLTEGVGDTDRGQSRNVFTTGGHSYGTVICYESVFGEEVRQFVLNGAEVLVNISNDAWYGDSSAPWQTLTMARMRAIENHRWLLRDTNTGITAAIDPQGRVAVEAPRHARAAFAFPFGFQPTTDLTFYTRHGDWFGWLCVVVTVGGYVAGFGRGRSRR